MKYMLSVCLIAFSFATSVVPSVFAQAAPLTRGVSVQMAASSHATAMPEADKEDAWVVAVTAEGKLYFGAEEMTAESLWEYMRTHPRNRSAKFYIKADARAPFAIVEKVLEMGRSGFFQTAVLLTAQTVEVAPGAIVPPMGLQVALGVPPAGAAVVRVQSGQNGSSVKVDRKEVSWPELQGALANRSEKVVVIKANGQAPFGDIARALDAGVAAGVRVVVDGMEL